MEATSEAWPNRRAGIRSTIFSCGIGALPGLRPSMMALSIRLSIMPGQTQLTRTPVPVHSHAALLVNPITACLLALYTAICGDPTRARDRGRC